LCQIAKIVYIKPDAVNVPECSYLNELTIKQLAGIVTSYFFLWGSETIANQNDIKKLGELNIAIFSAVRFFITKLCQNEDYKNELFDEVKMYVLGEDSPFRLKLNPEFVQHQLHTFLFASCKIIT
jgi:hypothetical protein